MTDTTVTVQLDDAAVPTTLTDRGAGRPTLLLHGGGGPFTVEGGGPRGPGRPPPRR